MVSEQDLQVVSRHQRNRPGSGESRSCGNKRTKKEHRWDPQQRCRVGRRSDGGNIGQASLRDATIGTGVAVDKVLALTGQMSSLNIVNVSMPSAEERAEMNALDRKLDAIAAKLKACRSQTAAGPAGGVTPFSHS